MSCKCDISGKTAQNGHRVSHAKNRTNHTFKANIQIRNVFIPEEGRNVKLRVSTRILRTIDKIDKATIEEVISICIKIVENNSVSNTPKKEILALQDSDRKLAVMKR